MRVQISETYDLSTKINKMGIVGVHTPIGPLVDRLYPGLVLNYKKFRYTKCDITMACASMLPADPLQVGMEAGAIAPQDMFNPILYKAVSNDTMNNFVNYIQYMADCSSTLALNGPSVNSVNSPSFSSGTVDMDQFQLYYSLLADPKGWRKAMPQSGLQMKNLTPLVFQVVENGAVTQAPYGDNDPTSGVIFDEYQSMIGSKTGPNEEIVPPAFNTKLTTPPRTSNSVKLYRGHAIRMPWVSTKSMTNATAVVGGATILPANYDYTDGTNLASNTGRVPPTYVACMVMPPAKLNVLYYRMRVTWTVEFSGLTSMTPTLGFPQLLDISDVSYGTDYAEQSAAMDAKENMVDTKEVSMTKIMEG